MFKLFFLFLFAAGWGLAAAALHVVRTPANFLTVSVVTKNDLSFEDTYVDSRTWTIQDVSKHRDLVARLLATGKSDVLAHVTDAHSSHDVSRQLSDAMGEAPAVEKPVKLASLDAALAQIKAGRISPADLAKLVASAR
ncbi:MAG TPA: hypothetical protein VFE58_14270 [Tepidisphaeraceae bacterium]|jgi:hypothetical protein|nr:hypothetical protein [Tepidisphaeraceae bacterium]